MQLRFLIFVLTLIAIGGGRLSAAPPTGELDRAFNPTIGRTETVRVRAIAVQPDGKFIIAGTFLKINNVQVNSVARFNADGTLDASFDAGGAVYGAVSHLALQPDGKILVGGSFDTVGRQFRRRIARLNADGSFDPTFNAPTTAGSGGVAAMAVQPDGKILAYGASLFGARNFARLNPDGTLDASLADNTAAVNSIAVQPDGRILLGFGGSATFGGEPRVGAARINADGTLDASFPNLNASSTVFKVVVLPDGKIMLGGLFSTISGQQYQRLVRLNANGTIDASFANNPNRVVSVRQIAVQSDGKVVYCGVGSPIYRDNADGTPDVAVAPPSRIFTDVDTVAALPDDRIVAGGRVLVSTVTPPSPSQTRHQPLALLAADGTIDDAVNPEITFSSGLSTVDVLVQPDGKILFAEAFEQILTPRLRHIIRLNADGSPDASFNFGPIPSNILGTGALVTQIARQSDGKIVFGTSSNSSNGNVFRVNADGSFDGSFAPTYSGTNSDIYRVEVLPDDDILLIGGFTQINGQPRAGFARLNADGSLDSFNPTLTAPQGVIPAINKVVVQPDGKFYLGGGFATVDGFATSSIARFQTNGTVDTSFSSAQNYANQWLMLAAQPDGKLLLATGSGLVRINANGTVDNGFASVGFRAPNGNFTMPIAAGVLPNGKILVGGSFGSTIDFTPRAGFARLNADGTLDTTYGTNGGTGGSVSGNTVYKIEIQPDGKALIAGQFQYVNNFSQHTLARLKTSAANGAPVSDFDGDGRTDAAVFRGGTWFVNPSGASQSYYAVPFGAAGDQLAPADYDGDGRTDPAVWREAEGNFYILNSSNNAVRVENFGLPGDRLTVGDWDGDGKADPAVYRDGAQGYFYYRGSLNNPSGAITYLAWGTSGDRPVRGDFDGDSRADAAVFRPSDQTWYIRRSSDNQAVYRQFGLASDRLVPGDYDGDGKTDTAVWRDGTWYIWQSSNGQIRYQQWGLASDTLAAGDWDGDGRIDPAVWRDGVFYILNSGSQQVSYRFFGTGGDLPVAAAFGH